jgi:putative methylase
MNLIFPKKLSWSSKKVEFFREIRSFVKILDDFSSPKIKLEQYTLPSDVIALILILADTDLKEKNVVDLGCGTGRFTLPIQKFYSKRTLGVDIDLDAINILIQLRKLKKLAIDILLTPVEFFEPFQWNKKFQTTFMNPPFGTKRRGLDLLFLRQALIYSQTIISLHKSNVKTRQLISNLGMQYEKKTEILATIDLPLAPSYRFHRKKQHLVCVDVIRMA